jgi:hypothetical protein
METPASERFRKPHFYGGFFVLPDDPATPHGPHSLAGASRVQRPNLGNFDMHTGYPRFRTSRAFSFWSDLKKLGFDMRGSRYFFTFLGLAIVVGTLLATQRRSLGPGAVAGGVALIGMAFTAMCVASLADAVDVPRHHLLFYVLSDMLAS